MPNFINFMRTLNYLIIYVLFYLGSEEKEKRYFSLALVMLWQADFNEAKSNQLLEQSNWLISFGPKWYLETLNP